MIARADRPRYTPADWYWIVDGSKTQVYSSARTTYVPVEDPAYKEWLKENERPSRIPNEEELGEVLSHAAPDAIPAGVKTGAGAFRNDPQAKQFLRRLRENTPAQLETWIDANAGTVTQMRVVLKLMVRVLALMVRRGAL